MSDFALVIIACMRDEDPATGNEIRGWGTVIFDPVAIDRDVAFPIADLEAGTNEQRSVDFQYAIQTDRQSATSRHFERAITADREASSGEFIVRDFHLIGPVDEDAATGLHIELAGIVGLIPFQSLPGDRERIDVDRPAAIKGEHQPATQVGSQRAIGPLHHCQSIPGDQIGVDRDLITGQLQAASGVDAQPTATIRDEARSRNRHRVEIDAVAIHADATSGSHLQVAPRNARLQPAPREVAGPHPQLAIIRVIGIIDFLQSTAGIGSCPALERPNVPVQTERIPVDGDEVVFLDSCVGAVSGDGDLAGVGPSSDVELHFAARPLRNVIDDVAVEVPAADHAVPVFGLVREVDVDLISGVDGGSLAERHASEPLVAIQINLLVGACPRVVLVFEEPGLGGFGVSLFESVDHLGLADDRLGIAETDNRPLVGSSAGLFPENGRRPAAA